MRLSTPRRPDEKSALTPPDEGARSQIKHQTTIHLFIKVEIEVVEGLLGIAKRGLLAAPFQQSFTTAIQFIRYQTGKQIDRCMFSACA